MESNAFCEGIYQDSAVAFTKRDATIFMGWQDTLRLDRECCILRALWIRVTLSRHWKNAGLSNFQSLAGKKRPVAVGITINCVSIQTLSTIAFSCGNSSHVIQVIVCFVFFDLHVPVPPFCCWLEMFQPNAYYHTRIRSKSPIQFL